MTVNYAGMMNPYMDTIMNAPVLSSGIGMGYGLGTFGGVLNPQYQMQTMQQWDNFGVNRQVAAYQNQNNAQFQMASQTENISRQIQILSSQIKANNQDNVKVEYNKLLAAVRSSYGSQLAPGITQEDKEAQIKAYAERLYAQQTGTYISDDIRNHSSSQFVSGLKQVFSFGLGNKTTADENIAMIEGTQQTRASKASKIAGNVVGCLLGGLLPVASFFCFGRKDS